MCKVVVLPCNNSIDLEIKNKIYYSVKCFFVKICFPQSIGTFVVTVEHINITQSRFTTERLCLDFMRRLQAP